ncbi:uncharacterized protein LOC132271096 [Cornus florida]|uniref:uncharacterized protein LOC132271096 n=1 Tax=Cornus florida TaxID=4283 RepID=UPI00289E56B9|nr:uncharacterized protein LOC132271096 [Cornus florida]XP_059628346.1 uncharacterized protein LOC132271096 [Cornus florida]
MFNNEVPFAFDTLHEFSAVDGFVELTECLAEIMKYVANEPSVGLFYVQQHNVNAVPNLINLKNNTVGKSQAMALHTEDLEDSITMVSSMKECNPIADEMIRDIKRSLSIMSTRQPKRGLIRNPSSGFQMGKTNSWGSANWGRDAVYMQHDGERNGSYLSTVLSSAKQRAINFKWPQFEFKEIKQANSEKLMSYPSRPPTVAAASTTLTMLETEADELPLSSPTADELQGEELPLDGSLLSYKLHSSSENYDEVRTDRERKLEEWLEGTGN